MSSIYCYKENKDNEKNENNDNNENDNYYGDNNEDEDKEMSVLFSNTNTPYIPRTTYEKAKYRDALACLILSQQQRRSTRSHSVSSCLTALGVIIWDHPGIRPPR